MVKIGLELDREELYQRINDRVLNMVEDGLEKEVKSLQASAHLNALQTVGYSEWKDYFDQKISREKVIENIQLNTRHYAKRQMTWFKRDPATTWFKAGSIEPKQVLL
jgi:tRNA dimethylallyltransferase